MATNAGGLKGMAERQMKRLNAMLEMLRDPDMRRAYDVSLFEAVHRRRVPPAGAARRDVDARRYLRLCWRLQVIRERTVLAADARRAGGWQGLMQSALRHWFWILTGLMIAGTGLWYVAGKA